MPRALTDIRTIQIPRTAELQTMTLEQLIEWREKLRPYYKERFAIQAQYGYFEFRKAVLFETIDKIVFNETNGIPRWQGIN